MWQRLARVMKSWIGFFISMAEDPEVMLQEAVEEMRATMPKLNSVLVATRATCIRLEDEKNQLERDERNLTSSIQAALAEGSPAARSVAEEDALQLQQLRMDLANTRDQLVSAQKAHENAQISVEALKARLKEKIETCQKAMKEHRKAKVLTQAADAITELQSYGVAATTDKYLEEIKQKVAESKASVEVATGGIDKAGIEKERASRRAKASGILKQFEIEMGIARPTSVSTNPAGSSGSTPGQRQKEGA